MTLFADALEILRDIHRFWVQYEIDIGTFEHLGDVTAEEVSPGILVLLNLCIEAYVEGPSGPAEPNPREPPAPTYGSEDSGSGPRSQPLAELTATLMSQSDA